jgi:DNA-directed RNA polymerase subunit RPC12/RpoP
VSETCNCVECGKEFTPFVTGHTVMCNECHSEVIRSLRSNTEPETKRDIPRVNTSENRPKYPPIKLPVTSSDHFDHDALIKHEKHYHSLKFHRKFYK